VPGDRAGDGSSVQRCRPPSVARLRGALRISGKTYADADGPVLPVLCHAGDLLSRWSRGYTAEVDALLEAIAAAGYHGVRTWTVLHGDYWRGREVGPTTTQDYWTWVSAFALALQARGLGWLVSQGDLCRVVTTTEARRTYLRRLLDVVPREVMLGCDLGNETWQNGEEQPIRLASAAQVVADRYPDLPLSLTSPPGETREELDAWSIAPATVWDVHGYRGGHWYDKVRHIFSVAYENTPTRRLGIQSEPFGPGSRVSVSDHKHELTAPVMQTAAVMSLMTRQAWVYFSGPGVMSDEHESLTAQPGFADTPAAVNLLPRDLHTGRLIHGGATWMDERVFAAEGEMRADHVLLSGQRWVCLLYGPSWATVASAVPEIPVTVEQDVSFGATARLVIGRTL